jgi:DNA-binding transcriptional MerR regulator
MTEERLYQVREVLKRIGISRNTLYNWEKRDWIPQPKRNVSGYRVYTDDELKKIEKLKNMLFVYEPLMGSKHSLRSKA